MELLPQALVDGIMLGAIYINIAVAFSLVYGVLHIIDFAVGEWIMLGAFTGYHLTLLTKVEPFLLLPIVFVIFAVLGLALQPLIQRVLSGHKGNPTLMALVFTFGLALMVRGLAQTFFGFYSHSIPSHFSNGSYFFQRGSFFVTISSVRLLGLIYAVVLTLLLNLMLRKTDFGLAIRALAMQKEAAGLMGVNAKKTNLFLFALYVGVTASTGVLIGVILSVASKMGPENSILAFFVVVLAGMGYLAGVPAAAFLLGIIQSIFLVYLNPGYTMMAVFGILYLILLVSPTGMFRRGM
ncbi:MAG: branched-chain amino acid ABC transporter permease [Holophaga sp.]|jgi:branched-chain amino acid transport system permease protein